MTPTSEASARAANEVGAVPARRPLSRPWKPPPRASRCGSSSAGLPPGLDQGLGGAPPAARRAGLQRRPQRLPRHLLPGSGSPANRERADAGCCHQPIVTGSGKKAVRTPAFKWANTLLGNLKTSLTGTFHAIRDKHVPRYLAQFQYRFNRRYDLAAMIPRLGWAAVRTPPMPYRLLKLAEVY